MDQVSVRCDYPIWFCAHGFDCQGEPSRATAANVGKQMFNDMPRQCWLFAIGEILDTFRRLGLTTPPRSLGGRNEDYRHGAGTVIAWNCA